MSPLRDDLIADPLPTMRATVEEQYYLIHEKSFLTFLDLGQNH